MEKKQRLTDGILSKIKKVPISNLTFLEDEENVVVHPESEIKLLEQSVSKFGQYRPIVIDEKGKILAGNAITKAISNLGEKEIYAVQYADLDESEKSALLLVDNYSSEMSFFRHGYAEELAMDIDINDFDLGDLVITDEAIKKVFDRSPQEVTITNIEGNSQEGEPNYNSKLARLGAYETEEGTKLNAGEFRCPNCNIILKR